MERTHTNLIQLEKLMKENPNLTVKEIFEMESSPKSAVLKFNIENEARLLDEIDRINNKGGIYLRGKDDDTSTDVTVYMWVTQAEMTQDNDGKLLIWYKKFDRIIFSKATTAVTCHRVSMSHMSHNNGYARYYEKFEEISEELYCKFLKYIQEIPDEFRIK